MATTGQLTKGGYIATPTANTTPAQIAAATAAGWSPVSAPVSTSGKATFSGGSPMPVQGSAAYNSLQGISGNVSYNPSTGVVSAIPVDTLGQTADNQVIPSKTAPTDQTQSILGINNKLGVTNNAVTDSNKTNNAVDNSTNVEAIYNQMSKILGARPSEEVALQAAISQSGEREARQRVNNIQSQLAQITSDMQQKQLIVTGQGRGIPEAIIGGQQAQFAKEAAILALPLQSQLAAAQGDLEYASSLLDKLFKVKSEDIQNEYNDRVNMYNFAYNVADKNQQRQIDEFKTKAGYEHDFQLQNISTLNSLSKEAMNNGQASLAIQIAGLDPKSPSFRSDLQLMQSKVISSSPAASQLYSGLSSATATAVRSQVSAFKTEPSITNFSVIQEAKNFVDSISPNTTNPADDQALIYSLAKVLDPNSVVREGEYATAQKYAQSWVNSFGKSVTQAIAGTGFLSETARKNIRDTITSKYNASVKSYDNVYSQYTNSINSLTGRDDGEKFMKDYKIATPSIVPKVDEANKTVTVNSQVYQFPTIEQANAFIKDWVSANQK
jgi:hypothetical protein